MSRRRKDNDPQAGERSAEARIDVWLWRARLAKTRPLAAKLAQSGHVRLNGRRIETAARAVRVGDVLTVALARTVRVLEIAALGERRGPAVEARTLYVEIGETPGPPE